METMNARNQQLRESGKRKGGAGKDRQRGDSRVEMEGNVTSTAGARAPHRRSRCGRDAPHPQAWLGSGASRMPRPEHSPGPPPHRDAPGRGRKFPKGRGGAVTEHGHAKLADAASVRLKPEALTVLSREATGARSAPATRGAAWDGEGSEAGGAPAATPLHLRSQLSKARSTLSLRIRRPDPIRLLAAASNPRTNASDSPPPRPRAATVLTRSASSDSTAECYDTTSVFLGLISLGTTPSRAIHLDPNGRVSSFFLVAE